jgi:glycosyltransferase involved in cell wall biosynthesis
VRLLALGSHLGRRPSGTRRRALGLLGELCNRPGVEVLLAGDPAPPEALLEAGVQMVPLREGLSCATGRWWRQDSEVAALLREFRPDFVLAEALPAPALPAPSSLVFTVHDLRHLRQGPRWKRILARRFLARALERAHQVHAVSGVVAVELGAAFPGTPVAAVVPNAPGLPPAPAAEEAQARRARLRVEAPYLLYVGHFEPRKGWATALFARELLARRGRDLPLVLAGAGEEMPETLVAELRAARPQGRRSLVLRGVGDPDLAALLAGAEAVLVPSRIEGFGLVPLEALAAGAPVVASAIPSHQEVLGEAAEYAPPGDAEAFAARVEGILLEGVEARERRRRSGLAQAGAYTWARAADLFLAALNPRT